jgi:hypothetical protein
MKSILKKFDTPLILLGFNGIILTDD